MTRIENEALEHKLDRNIEQAVLVVASKIRQVSAVVREFLGQTTPETITNVKAIMTDTVCSCSRMTT